MEYLIYIADSKAENVDLKYNIIREEKTGDIKHIIKSKNLKRENYVKIKLKNHTIINVYGGDLKVDYYSFNGKLQRRYGIDMSIEKMEENNKKMLDYIDFLNIPY